MNKAELRKIYQAKRAQLSKEQVEAGSKRICDLLFKKFKFGEVSSVHIFLPIETKNEVNTNFIISRLWDKFPSVKVVVPKIADLAIESFVLTPETKLFKNSLGVPEPLNGAPFSHPQIDFVLLPLLAFDKSGNRIGYGKGFYDRFLTTCKPHVTKVGLSLFEAEESIEPDAFDVPMNFCMTPEKFYSF